MDKALGARLCRQRKLCVQKQKDVNCCDSEECEEGMGNETEQEGSDQIIKGQAK